MKCSATPSAASAAASVSVVRERSAYYDPELDKMFSDDDQCVDCMRCETLCPTRALTIRKSERDFRTNANWRPQIIKEVYRQAESGGLLLSSMEQPRAAARLLGQNSHQRLAGHEPFHRPAARARGDEGFPRQEEPQHHAQPRRNDQHEAVPAIGALHADHVLGHVLRLHQLQRAQVAGPRTTELGTYYNTGEGGLHRDFYEYGPNTIVQVASGRFGVYKDYLEAGAAIEMKWAI